METVRKIEFCRHNLDEKDIEYAEKTLRTLFLTTGSVTAEFEKKFAEYAGLPHAIAVTSCTAALHLSLLALDIGPGDEVITTPMTFLASATSIMHTGAKPVFADVLPENGLMDPAKVKKAITKKTKAILPVHLYGAMVDMKAIKKIADESGLKIVEDCAHAIESERDGVRPGDLSDAACYSFYATKNLTSGEGGAVGTKKPDLAERVKILRLHGMSSDAASRYTSLYKHYDMIALGWKYNMDNIHASLLVHQIDRLESALKRREEIARRYEMVLKSIPGIEVPTVPGKSARHLQTFWVKAEIRDEILKKLQERGIGVAVNYKAMHTFTYFKETFGYKAADFPIAYEIGRRTITLPLYPKMTEEEVNYVIAAIKETFKQ